MANATYTDAERATLDAVLDTVVPPDAERGLPGAGEIGIGTALEREQPALTPLVANAVAQLDAIARDSGSDAFVALDGAGREAALRAHAERDPGFLPGLLFQVFAQYYIDPRVVTALGMEARPPFPKGYDVAPSDLDTLLAPVRSGPKRYREV